MISMDNNSCMNRTFIMPLTQIKIIAGRYLFPPLFVIGLLANALNLIILNRKGMRTRTNSLLSAMAFADVCFFICLMPSELIAFDYYQNSYNYMKFFIYSRMSLTAVTNFFSTASTWLAMIVTLERVVAIKMPLHAKFYFTRRRIYITIILIYIISFALNCYNFVCYDAFIQSFCNETKFIYGLQIVNETVSPNLHKYVQISWLISPFFIVYIPMIILIILNTNLLYHLDKNRQAMSDATRTPQIRSNEHKVAFTVAVIILSFILLSTPSAVLHLHEWFRLYVHEYPKTQTFLQAATIANMFVVLNKASNFLLYFTVSSKFRQHFMQLMCNNRFSSSPVHNNSTQRRSTMTSLFLPNDNNRLWQRVRKLRKTNSCTAVVVNDNLSPRANILKKYKRYTADQLITPSLNKKLREKSFSKPVYV